MIHRVRSLVTVLALTLPGVASADPMSTFLQQDKYTYCDVKMLSALWKQSIGDAKVTVGAKLEARNTAYIDTQLKSARTAARTNTQARCNYSEAGFSYDDATKLAGLWKVDTGKAKAMIEDKILAGGEKSLRAMLQKSGGTAIAQSGEDPVATFLKQDTFGSCEVKLLSARWKTSAKDAKARIGLKLQTGNESYVRNELKTARETGKTKCTAADAGFTAYDVKRMKELWSLTVADVERKITNGSASTLRGMLADNPPPEGDLATFANQTRYTYCDAHMLGMLWKRTARDGKAFIGAKLTAKKKGEIDKAVALARKNAVANERARCGYYNAGLSYDDLMTLAALWKKPEDEMKAEVALRIAKGQEAAIKAQLKKANAKKPKQPLQQTPPPPPPAPPTKTKADAEPDAPTKAPAAPTKAAPTKAPAAPPAPTKAP